nr:class I tRNA ligase family protein [Thiothrix subterranea]
MLPLDRWAVDQAAQVQDKVLAAYDHFNFHLIAQEVLNFCTVELGSLFLDITKDRQYTMQAGSLGRRSAQTAAWHILNALVRWLYPVLSFTAEEIWQSMPGKKPRISCCLRNGMTGCSAWMPAINCPRVSGVTCLHCANWLASNWKQCGLPVRLGRVWMRKWRFITAKAAQK